MGKRPWVKASGHSWLSWIVFFDPRTPKLQKFRFSERIRLERVHPDSASFCSTATASRMTCCPPPAPPGSESAAAPAPRRRRNPRAWHDCNGWKSVAAGWSTCAGPDALIPPPSCKSPLRACRRGRALDHRGGCHRLENRRLPCRLEDRSSPRCEGRALPPACMWWPPASAGPPRLRGSVCAS